jgi:hypothetical protein
MSKPSTLPKLHPYDGSSDPEDWSLQYGIYCDAAGFNEDKTKIRNLAVYLKNDAWDWYYGEDFSEKTTWAKFREEFVKRFRPKRHRQSAFQQISVFHKKESESYRRCIDRFRKLHRRYREEYLASKEELEQDKTTPEESKSVPRVPEATLIDYFFDGLTPTMRMLIRRRSLKSLQDAYDAVLELDDQDEDDTLELPNRRKSSSSNSSTSTKYYSLSSDSESPERNGKSRTLQKTVKLSEPKKTSAKKEVSTDEELSNLLSGLHIYYARNPDKLALLNQQVQQAATPQQPAVQPQAPPPRVRRCGNCYNPEHAANACPNPCKYCQANHRYYECSQHRPFNRQQHPPAVPQQQTFMVNAYANDSGSDSDSLDHGYYYPDNELEEYGYEAGIEETYPAEKRSLSNSEPDVVTTKRARAMRLGSIIDPEVVPQVKKSKSPRKRYIASPVASKPYSISDIANTRFLPVSLADLVDMDKNFLPRLKKVLTPEKIEVPAKPKKQSKLPQPVFTMNLPYGNSAPRAPGHCNGQQCEIVLDGGSTSNMVSLDLIKRLGIRQMLPSNMTFIMANGARHRARGLVKVIIGIEGQERKVQAHVF